MRFDKKISKSKNIWPAENLYEFSIHESFVEVVLRMSPIRGLVVAEFLVAKSIFFYKRIKIKALVIRKTAEGA